MTKEEALDFIENEIDYKDFAKAFYFLESDTVVKDMLDVIYKYFQPLEIKKQYGKNKNKSCRKVT